METPFSSVPVCEVPRLPPFDCAAASASSTSNNVPFAGQALPPPLQHCERCENDKFSLEEKLSLVALTCFGILASIPAFLFGCAVGFVCYEVIDGAAQRNHYYALIRKIGNETDAWLVVSITAVAMWIIKQVGPLLCASSTGAGIYVGVRLAKYTAVKFQGQRI